VLGWGSDEPSGTTYDVMVDGSHVTRIVTAGLEAADVEDSGGNRRKSNAPVQVYLSSGSHRLEVIKNGKPHWSKTVDVRDSETEFYFSLPDPGGESPEPANAGNVGTTP
jgi:hypothetical protein